MSDLEKKGCTIYNNACLNRDSREQCRFFNECEYFDLIDDADDPNSKRNTIRICTHTSLFLHRYELEQWKPPDLTIIDETFLS